MESRPSGVRVCGVFNIIAGCAGGFCGMALLPFYIGFGACVSEVTALWALLLAGVLAAISGVCLLSSAWRVALLLLALAVVLSLIFCVLMVGSVVSGEDILFIGLPGLVTLLAIIELFYLWWFYLWW